MNKILHIFLISLFSLTVISCAEKEESTDSTATTTTTTTSSGLYVAVGITGTILTSADATTWTSRTSGTSNHLYGVTYGNSTYIKVVDNGTILTSTDVTTWTPRTSGVSNWIDAPIYKNSTFMTIGDNGTISPQLMVQLGLQERLVHQTISLTSHMETVHSLQLVILEQFSPHRMEQVGLLGLLEQQKIF